MAAFAVALAGCGTARPADPLGSGTSQLPGDVVDVRLTTTQSVLPAGGVDPPTVLPGDTSPPVSPPPTPAAFPTQARSGGLHSATAAREVADALVAGVPVPPGAVLQSGAPPSALGPGTTAAVETKADALRWYVVPGDRDAAIEWLTAHSPGGFTWMESTKVSDTRPADLWPRFLSLGSEQPARQPLGSVQVTVVKDGDHTEVRVSAEVIWTPPKPAVELIPDAVKTGVLVYHRDRTLSGLPQIDKQITLTATQVDRLRRLLNPMRPVAPGESSCAEAPDEATLSFRYGGHLVVFTADLGGCSFITISADGKEQPYLRGGYALAGPIRTLVGLPATPPA